MGLVVVGGQAVEAWNPGGGTAGMGQPAPCPFPSLPSPRDTSPSRGGGLELLPTKAFLRHAWYDPGGRWAGSLGPHAYLEEEKIPFPYPTWAGGG